MLGDHSPRIYAQQQQAVENSAMEALEQRAAPLLWAIIAAIVVCLVAEMVNDTTAFVRHHSELVQVNHALAACMNGHAISLGDAELKCQVREYKKFVSGVAAQGEQL